ncbi:glucuronyl esterase domain-containing protein [Cyclobacterium qasimii]|uniref:Glycoprotein gp2 n=2 Tax=Cyclobacterium qasimii TaxID=1350429 RepID=S7WVZ9_9BACT|nr:alpha/beta hydrolase [Cyclobacterium qasimii]EPR70949.1 Glycoprotein gp2 [Cyclobacterium qasimii M12-11B]GEO19892.1 acetylxylan esterase [Cyclobacterium qasimii]
MTIRILLLSLIIVLPFYSFAQSLPVDSLKGYEVAGKIWPTSYGRNWEEANVGDYSLPDPLLDKTGQKITSSKSWEGSRRNEIMQDFSELMYGHTPEFNFKQNAEIVSVRKDALDGLATRTIINLRFFEDPSAPTIQLMLYLPNAAKEPVPVVMKMNWYGNSSLEKDPSIPHSTKWMRPIAEKGVVDNRVTEATRGINAYRFPNLKELMKRGYGLATFYYGDVEPDHIDGWKDGIRGYVMRTSGKSQLKPNEWGALGAWAWGMSRSLDYLQTVAAVDSDRVALIGHSRHGKAVLWAGAQDQRFAVVIANDSGEGGAALARRNFGENIAYSIGHASWRYCEQFRNYIDKADELPFDQHMLLSMIAPRPLYVASATDDLLADPKGEFLSTVHAGPVYELYGLKGLGTNEMPLPDTSIGNEIRYHIRSGDHDLTQFDWKQYLQFLDFRFNN